MAAQTLTAADPTAVWGILKDGAADTNAIRRAQAIAALATVQTPESEKLVKSAVTDKDYIVRLSAVSGLAERKSRATIPMLKLALDDETAEVSFTAAKALWEMGDHSGKEILAEVLAGERKQSPGFIKQEIREAKATMHNRKALVWMGAKEGAGLLFGPLGAGLGVMEMAMKDGSAPARVLSVTLLAQDKDVQSLADLKDALFDKSPLVKLAAAKALGGFTDRTVVPALEPLLEEKNDALRYMAAASILRAGKRNTPKKA
jgi:HEAT repeat protein